jgi:tetratricopeptide (TPR) repeat protein
VINFGDDYPLFVESDQLSGYLQTNPEVIKRYFPAEEFAPKISPDTYYFPKEKANDTFRIVLQGGSTAAGFPFGRFGSPADMLKTRFKRQYPSKHIEVINTAMSAVNSYTLLDFVDEILAIKPDLVMIYAGHNEYLGLMGVGSSMSTTTSGTATLIYLKLRQLKIYQLLQSIYASLFLTAPEISSADANRTLMATIASGQRIPYDSELYHAGIDQLTTNLELIINEYQEHAIPVVIGTLASNEGDQAPFASEPGEAGADAAFKRGKMFRTQNNIGLARKAFNNARERDLLRFRAPMAFNQVIRELSKRPGVYLADSEKEIRKEANDYIIDHKHMYEHLHPNARGYFLLTEAFNNTINNEQLVAQESRTIARDRAWQDIPLTPVDIHVADFKIRQLLSDYPFTDEPREVAFGDQDSYEKRLAYQRLQGASWLQQTQDMLNHYQATKQLDKAAKVAGILFDALPNQQQIAQLAGQLYFDIGDYGMATYYQHQALRFDPENVELKMLTSRAYYQDGYLSESLALIDEVLAVEPDHKIATIFGQRIRQMLAKNND